MTVHHRNKSLHWFHFVNRNLQDTGENVCSLLYICVQIKERNMVGSDKRLDRVNGGKTKCSPVVISPIQSSAQVLWSFYLTKMQHKACGHSI